MSEGDDARACLAINELSDIDSGDEMDEAPPQEMGMQPPPVDLAAPSITPLLPDLVIPDLYAASFPPPVAHSRFYITRRLVIGNSFRTIPPYRRTGKMAAYKFQWKLYLTCPTSLPLPDGGTRVRDDIATFVKKVRFYLHPDYRPYDVVDVSTPPFTLVR